MWLRRIAFFPNFVGGHGDWLLALLPGLCILGELYLKCQYVILMDGSLSQKCIWPCLWLLTARRVFRILYKNFSCFIVLNLAQIKFSFFFLSAEFSSTILHAKLSFFRRISKICYASQARTTHGYQSVAKGWWPTWYSYSLKGLLVNGKISNVTMEKPRRHTFIQDCRGPAPADPGYSKGRRRRRLFIYLFIHQRYKE